MGNFTFDAKRIFLLNLSLNLCNCDWTLTRFTKRHKVDCNFCDMLGCFCTYDQLIIKLYYGRQSKPSEATVHKMYTFGTSHFSIFKILFHCRLDDVFQSTLRKNNIWETKSFSNFSSHLKKQMFLTFRKSFNIFKVLSWHKIATLVRFDETAGNHFYASYSHLTCFSSC